MDVSDIFLRRNSTGEMAIGQLWDGVKPSHLGQWERTWKRIMEDHRRTVPRASWVEDAHWDWRKKHLATAPFLAFRWFTITCEGDLQGLMLLDLNQSCRIISQFGKPLVYVDFIATAPWNRPSFEDPPRFSNVGRTFILAATEVSREEGFQGRIGLHALHNAVSFYENRCGMTSLGQDSAKSNLCYLEMTKDQADSFCL
jgi:hypothetical protein